MKREKLDELKRTVENNGGGQWVYGSTSVAALEELHAETDRRLTALEAKFIVTPPKTETVADRVDVSVRQGKDDVENAGDSAFQPSPVVGSSPASPAFRVGDRVRHDLGCFGTVEGVSPYGLDVKFDDGSSGGMMHTRYFTLVSRPAASAEDPSTVRDALKAALDERDAANDVIASQRLLLDELNKRLDTIRQVAT